MLKIESLEELNLSEMKDISGGGPISYLWGIAIAGYIDFEIGMAIGIGNTFADAWDAL